jgi:hypothetical protein
MELKLDLSIVQHQIMRITQPIQQKIIGWGAERWWYYFSEISAVALVERLY